MKKIIVSLAMVATFLAVFVAQVSAAQACLLGFYDPEIPEELK